MAAAAAFDLLIKALTTEGGSAPAREIPSSFQVALIDLIFGF